MKKFCKMIICLILMTTMVSNYMVFSSEEDVDAKIYTNIDVDSEGVAAFSDEVINQGTLYAMVDYLSFGGQGAGIVLSDDIKLNRGLTLHPALDAAAFILIDGDITLDLNGFFITQLSGINHSSNALIIIPRNSRLTVTDSSSEKKGIINGVVSAISVAGGELIIDNGLIMAQSQASAAPDQGETPVKIANGGKFVMNGGTIEHSGMLADGRVYSDESFAITSDDLSEVKIKDGNILGALGIGNAKKWEITGGCFETDVSDYISMLYESKKTDDVYVVKSVLPMVSGKSGSSEINVDMSAKYNEAEKIIYKHILEANCPDAEGEISLDVTELFAKAKPYGASKYPEVEVLTNFAKLSITGDVTKKIKEESAGKRITLSLSKNSNMDKSIKDKLESAQYEVSYKLSSEGNTLIAADSSLSMEILHNTSSSAKKTQLYSVKGSGILPKGSEVLKNSIRCVAGNNEKILVSEGNVIMIAGRTLDLQGTISLIFYAALEGVDVAQTRMLFWDAPQTDYTEKTAKRIVSYTGKDANGYRFEYKNISSKDMNKKIYARLVTTDSSGNKVYSNIPTDGYSVVSYAENMMKNSQLKPLLVKMLNYGAAAQSYFNATDVPANSILTDAERVMDMTKIYRSEADTIVENTKNGKCSSKIAGKTLTLEGDISINYYVSPIEKADEVGILFWTEDAFKLTQNHIMGTQSDMSKEYTTNGQYRVFSFGNIFSSQMFEPVYARIYTKTGNIYKYSDIDKYSVKDYAANQIEKNSDPRLINLLRCLLLYGDEAEKYFRLN